MVLSQICEAQAGNRAEIRQLRKLLHEAHKQAEESAAEVSRLREVAAANRAANEQQVLTCLSEFFYVKHFDLYTRIPPPQKIKMQAPVHS